MKLSCKERQSILSSIRKAKQLAKRKHKIHMRYVKAKQRFIDNKRPLAIPKGLDKLERQERAELYRKDRHLIKQKFKATGLNTTWLKEHRFENIGLRCGSHVISKQLVNAKVVNKLNGKLPFEHFC